MKQELWLDLEIHKCLKDIPKTEGRVLTTGNNNTNILSFFPSYDIVWWWINKSRSKTKIWVRYSSETVTTYSLISSWNCGLTSVYIIMYLYQAISFAVSCRTFTVANLEAVDPDNFYFQGHSNICTLTYASIFCHEFFLMLQHKERSIFMN